MIFELCNCTQVLLYEIGIKEIKQKDIACTYAIALKSSDQTNWELVNKAIINRWSISGLKRIKDMAWSSKCFNKKMEGKNNGKRTMGNKAI